VVENYAVEPSHITFWPLYFAKDVQETLLSPLSQTFFSGCLGQFVDICALARLSVRCLM
jgi:hypothetical protein